MTISANQVKSKNFKTMDLRKDKKKGPQQPQAPLIHRVLKELGIEDSNFAIIGHGSHYFSNAGFKDDPATKETLVSYMVVDAGTLVWLLNKDLPSYECAGYRFATLMGDGPNGQGGVTFVAAKGPLSPVYNSIDTQYEFLKSQVIFTSMMVSAVAINVAAYLASCDRFKDRFFQEFTYDYVKSLLRRDSNLGPSLFFEPNYFWQGVALVNKTREVPGWFEKFDKKKKKFISKTGPDCKLVDAILEDYEIAMVKDPEVLQYYENRRNPNYIHPNGHSLAGDFSMDPLFQKQIEPDSEIVQPYNPDL